MTSYADYYRGSRSGQGNGGQTSFLAGNSEGYMSQPGASSQNPEYDRLRKQFGGVASGFGSSNLGSTSNQAPKRTPQDFGYGTEGQSWMDLWNQHFPQHGGKKPFSQFGWQGDQMLAQYMQDYLGRLQNPQTAIGYNRGGTGQMGYQQSRRLPPLSSIATSAPSYQDAGGGRRGLQVARIGEPYVPPSAQQMITY